MICKVVSKEVLVIYFEIIDIRYFFGKFNMVLEMGRKYYVIFIYSDGGQC